METDTSERVVEIVEAWLTVDVVLSVAVFGSDDDRDVEPVTVTVGTFESVEG